MTRDWSVEAVVERAKREILADVRDGVVPEAVTDFANLHDYVDANGYGGAFEGDAPEPASDLWNEAQARLNDWIESGEMRAEWQRGGSRGDGEAPAGEHKNG